MRTKIELEIKYGKDKSFSPFMQWQIKGYGGLIEREQSGSVNASSYLRKSVNWRAYDNKGNYIKLPTDLNKHEKSIAKYILSL